MKYKKNIQDIFAAQHNDASPATARCRNILRRQHQNIIDLLRTAPSSLSFSERIRKLGLSPELEKKALDLSSNRTDRWRPGNHLLSENNEKELAGEVLMCRHEFTRLVFENGNFRQAALTVIQNIYLFRQRKIFFGTSHDNGERERQEALLLFSSTPDKTSVPLARTFQHLILARVWDRIISQASEAFLDSTPFAELHEVVERLNTLRNIYMLLSVGLVYKLTANINNIYKQSVTHEDARQIGSFGIARAAYRYHPSSGMRFSTYAAHWILKEIQRQALEGRLIRVSSNLVEKISRQARAHQTDSGDSGFEQLCRATAQFALSKANDTAQQPAPSGCPEDLIESRQIHELLHQAITEVLPPKSADVIMRRYGLGPHRGKEQSAIEIARFYGVTRSSIYQLEQNALRRLRQHLA